MAPLNKRDKPKQHRKRVRTQHRKRGRDSRDSRPLKDCIMPKLDLGEFGEHSRWIGSDVFSSSAEEPRNVASTSSEMHIDAESDSYTRFPFTFPFTYDISTVVIVECVPELSPYTPEDVLLAAREFPEIKEVKYIGSMYLNYVFAVSFWTQIAAEQFVSHQTLSIKGQPARLARIVGSMNVVVQLHWLPPEISDNLVRQKFAPFGDVLSVRQIKCALRGFEHVDTTSRILILKRRPGIELSAIPYLLHIAGFTVAVSIRNRPPMCYKFKIIGHTCAHCTAAKCSHCREFGHSTEDYPGKTSYAAVFGGSGSVPSLSESPMPPEVPPADGDAQVPPPSDTCLVFKQQPQGNSSMGPMETEMSDDPLSPSPSNPYLRTGQQLPNNPLSVWAVPETSGTSFATAAGGVVHVASGTVIPLPTARPDLPSVSYSTSRQSSEGASQVQQAGNNLNVGYGLSSSLPAENDGEHSLFDPNELMDLDVPLHIMGEKPGQGPCSIQFEPSLLDPGLLNNSIADRFMDLSPYV